ncbi:MAG: hypothetical protein KAX50_07775, partial [Saprospiraceae bacterium]|nr:hypothetical protein [Saprospiraceae bacterium]
REENVERAIARILQGEEPAQGNGGKRQATTNPEPETRNHACLPAHLPASKAGRPVVVARP